MRYVLVLWVVLLTCLGCGQKGSESQDKGSSSSSKDQKPATATNLKGSEVEIDKDAQQKAGILVEAVTLVSTPEYLDAVGQVDINDERTAHIGSYTDGRVIEVKANVGDRVARGEVLARMHSHDVHETRAAYETAQETVARQENALAYQLRLRDRMRRLYNLKSASRLEVDKAESDVRSAENDLASAKIAVQKEVAHLTDILHLPETAINNLTEETEQVPVISPIAGTVVERRVNAGSVVEPGDEVFVVSNLNSLWMVASVNEADVSKVHVGDKALLLAKAFPDQAFPGKVTRISTQLDPQSRTLPVRILVPNPENKLKTLMFVQARILQGNSAHAIFLNEDAVQDLNGGNVAFVRKTDTVFEARPIQIAQRLHGRAEVTSGLKAGDMVVLKGSFVVKSQMLKSQIGE